MRDVEAMSCLAVPGERPEGSIAAKPIVLALLAKQWHGVVVVVENLPGRKRLVIVILEVLENRDGVFQSVYSSLYALICF